MNFTFPRKILVALDGSPHSLATLQSAAQLAAYLNAELHGLFVEDDRIVASASNPAGRVVSSITATAQVATPALINRQLKAQGIRLRSVFERTIAVSGVAGTFQIARGRVADTIRTVVPDADILALGHTGWAPRSRGSLGSSVESFLGSNRLVFLARKGTSLCTPVVALIESETDRHVLSLGQALAAACPCSFAALCSGSEAEAMVKDARSPESSINQIELVSHANWATRIRFQRATYLWSAQPDLSETRQLIEASAVSGSPVMLLPKG